MKFTTQSGSVYEVNQTDKQIRRVSGSKKPTLRQGQDGDWKSYSTLSPIKVGQPVVIVWAIVDGTSETVFKTTFTSDVTEINDGL